MSYIVVRKPNRNVKFDCGSPELISTEDGKVFFDTKEEANRIADKHRKLAPAYDFQVCKTSNENKW